MSLREEPKAHLLLRAEVNDFLGKERAAIIEIKRANALLEEQRLRMRELNRNHSLKISILCGEEREKEILKYEEEREIVLARVAELDRVVDAMADSEIFIPVIEKIREKERKKAHAKFLERQEKEWAEKEDKILREYNEKKAVVLARKAQEDEDKKNKIEAQIEGIRSRIQRLDEDINGLGFFCFGEQRQYKMNLKRERTALQNQLVELYAQRRKFD